MALFVSQVVPLYLPTYSLTVSFFLLLFFYRRVSGAGNSVSRKYYTDTLKTLNTFRKENKDKYPVAEEWLEKKIRDAAASENGQSVPVEPLAEEEEEVEIIDGVAGVTAELEMNPAIELAPV